MTKSEAESIFREITNCCLIGSVENAAKLLSGSEYPVLAEIYLNYIHCKPGFLNIGDYRDQALHHIQVSGTKLYRAMK